MNSQFLTQLPKIVRVVEVGPRDGLQNEVALVSTEDKVRFIELLTEAGYSDIEVSSFVSPKRVPQLADAAEVFASLAPHNAVRYSALVPNAAGLERAHAAGVKTIALFTAASETFTQQNIGMSIAESLDRFRLMLPLARSYGMRVRAYVSTAFVCPYEGIIAVEQVTPIVRELAAIGVDEVSLGDTIGRATPFDVANLTEAVLPTLGLDRLAYHFHDTSGFALANVLIALQYGVAVFDSSAGGTGGCPFAPGASGNLATEDLIAFLDEMGIETGIDLAKVAVATQFLSEKLGRPLKIRS